MRSILLVGCLLLAFIVSPISAQEAPGLPSLEVITAENAGQVTELTRYGNGVLSNTLAFSPDGEKIAVGGSLGVWIFETDNLNTAPQFLPHDAWVENLDWSPNGDLLAVVTRAYEVHLWDLTTNMLIDTFGGRNIVRFSPDGEFLAVGSQRFDGDSYFLASVSLLDLDTRNYVAEFSLGTPESRVTDIAFSLDGQWIAAVIVSLGTGFCFVDEGYYIGVWSLPEGLELGQTDGEVNYNSLPGIYGAGFDVDFTPDNEYIVRNAYSEVSLWSLEYLQKEEWDPIGVYTPIAQPDDGFVEKVAFSGRIIATITRFASTDYSVQLYTSTDGELLDTLPIWEGSELVFTMDSPASQPDWWTPRNIPYQYYGATALEFSPDGDQLAALVQGELTVWDIRNNNLQEMQRFSFTLPEIPAEFEVAQGITGFICENFETPEGAFCGYFNQDRSWFVHYYNSSYWLWNLADLTYTSLPFPAWYGVRDAEYVTFSPDASSVFIVQQYWGNCTFGPGYGFQW